MGLFMNKHMAYDNQWFQKGISWCSQGILMGLLWSLSDTKLVSPIYLGKLEYFTNLNCCGHFGMISLK